MKPAPKSPEFERFTEALRQIMSVPRTGGSNAPQIQEKARTKRASSGCVSRDKD